MVAYHAMTRAKTEYLARKYGTYKRKKSISVLPTLVVLFG